MLWKSLPTVAIAVLTVMPSALAAQATAEKAHVRGRVSQGADTTAVVVGADVELVGTGFRAYTDREGRFRFDDVTPGEYDLRVRRIGYEWTIQRVVVAPGSVAIADVQMGRAIPRLTEVLIEGRRVKVPARYEAVYWRASRGWGKLFTRDELQYAFDVKSVLGRLPTIHDNDRGITFDRCQAGLSGLTLVAGGSMGSKLGGGTLSAPPRPGKVQVYVDGHRMTWTSDGSFGSDADAVLKSIPVYTIEAIEVYSGVARIPAEFLSDACAVVAIWTKAY